MTTEHDDLKTRPHPARWRALGFLGLAQLMLILDVTVVAIALPHIQTDLGVSREAVTWTVSAYTLAFGGLMLLGGRLADVLTSRRVLFTGLTVFTLASLFTGFSGSAEALIGGRVAQGVGAALMSPAALSQVVTLFEGDERNRALGIWSALGGGGAALGVLVGGLLTGGPGWTWVFWVNVPIGVLILVALAVLLPAQPAPSARTSRTVDVLGAALVTASSATLIYALIDAGESGWWTVRTGLLVLAAAVGFALFVGRQRTARTPLMDLGLLTRRPVATGAFLILVATALMIAVFFLGTFYFQHARGHGALQTGLLFLPVALATMAGANLTGRVLSSVGARAASVVGLLLAAAGLGLSALTLGNSALVVVGVALAAAGTGALFVVASATALGQVAAHEAGIASGIVSMFHEFGASLGAAVTSSVAAVSLIDGSESGFTHGFTVAAGLSVLAAAIAAVVVPSRPASTT